MGKLQVGQVMSININSFIADHIVTKKYAYSTLHALFLPAISITPAKLVNSIFISSLFYCAIQC